MTINKKYCHLAAFTLALALAAPFVSCGSGDGDGDEGPGDPPAAPQNFKAVTSDGKVRLTWTSEEGLTYDLFFSEARGFGLESGTKLSDITAPYVHHMGLMDGTTYYYRLAANTPSGASSSTDEIWAIIPALGAPGTPQNFEARASTRQVTLTWDSHSDVTYGLFFSTTRKFTLDQAADSFSDVTSPHIHGNLMDDTTYYYRLTANVSSVASAPTAEVSARTPALATLPATPQNLMAAPLDRRVRLTWNPGDNDVTYELFFSTTQGFTPASATGSFPNVTSPHTHDGLTNGTTYYYILTANKPSGASVPTPEVSAAPIPLPGTPQNFMAIPLDRQVRLTWSSGDDDVTYELFFSTSSGFFGGADGSFPNVTSPHIHDNLTNGITYYYLLRGNNSSGGGGTTPQVSAIPTPPPETPENFKAVVFNRQVTLTWDSQPDVTYELLFSTSTGFTVGNPEGSFPDVTSPHTHRDLANDTTYYYLLRASNPAGTSMPTSEVSATTLLVKPENFTAVASNDQVELTWDVQSGLTYQLFRSTNRNFPMSGDTVEVSDTAMPPYTDSGLMNGIRYYYRLVANRPSGTSAPANMSIPAEAAAAPYTAQADPAGRLSAGRYHTCALMDEAVDRRVKCWGDLREGQLGNGLRGIALSPMYAGNPAARRGTQSSPGEAPACALVGGALCWEELIDHTKQVTQVSAGETHTCAVLDGGALCWGEGADGQLGNSLKLRRTTPVRVAGLTSGVTQISAGGGHTCGVVSNGALCWGRNDRGQLGDGGNIDHTAPQQVMGLTVSGLTIGALTSGATQISAGDRHTCAVVGGGALCWGEGADGQLGNGLEQTTMTTMDSQTTTFNRKNTPQQVMGLTEGVTQISAGTGHTCAVVSGGAFCWGGNDFGQLGSGDNTKKLVPHQVTGLTVTSLTSGVTQISAGTGHTCAVVDGRALCWGWGTRGQLGNSGASNANIPQQVTGLTEGVTQISAGTDHTCALAGGRFVCWGSALNGRLGNNAREGVSLVPVPVQNQPL